MAIDLDVATRLSTDVVRLLKTMESMRASTPRFHPGAEPSAYPLLFALCARPMRVSALAETVHSDTSTISRQVTHLASHGLLEKVPDPTDGRAQMVALAPAGRDLVERMQTGRGQWFQELMKDWEPGEADDFGRYVRRFTTELTAELDRLRNSDAASTQTNERTTA